MLALAVRYLSSVQDWDSTSTPHQKTKMFDLALVLSLIQTQMNIGQLSQVFSHATPYQ
jgi:hypothetical protein